MKLVTFVVPVYRNEGALKILHSNLRKEFTSQFPEMNYEIIFVNDGSDDGSYDEMLKIRKEDANVKVISLSRNFGQMGAIMAGWDNSKGDATINISADMQEPVEQFTRMIREWLDGTDIVIGTRENRQDSAWAKFKSRIFYSIMRMSIPQMPSGGFDITLLDRKALNTLNSLKERGRFYQGNILWLGYSVKFIPYTRLKRTLGKSQNSSLKMLVYTLNALLNVTYIPIRIMTFTGIFTALVGFIYAIVIVYAYFVDKVPYKGWAPIMVLLLIIGGFIMVMLGIIGEYIWRILDEVKGRPNYIIREKFD
jgi:polyisoprenyl-phosphate glycosyltransferase